MSHTLSHAHLHTHTHTKTVAIYMCMCVCIYIYQGETMPIRVAPKTAATRTLIRPALCFGIMLVFQVEECFDIFCRYDFLVNASEILRCQCVWISSYIADF
jgi:hypothetical protein